jgi:hypothetical protein
MHIFGRKYLQSRDPEVARAPLFSGSPALIPDLILPVEVGIAGGPTAPQQHLIFQVITTGIDSSQVSEKLCNLWRRKILSGLLCVATQSSFRVTLTRTVARLWCYFRSQMWLSWG